MKNINYYSTAEAARICNVSRGSILRWIHEGKLKSSATFGGHQRISCEELATVLKKLNMPVPVPLQMNHPKGGLGRILIVDDDEGVRRLIHRIVAKRFPTYEIEEAENGFEAGYKVHEGRPGLIILDIQLPGLDGYDICTLIRKSLPKGEAVVIAISAHGERALNSMLDFGADDILPKPFTPDQLVAKLEKYLRDGDGGKAEQVS